ncbi:hypothetical protein BKA57DRAFT_491938 [Linnemannia elongata]|nr:hypothetical protein BKA57DRAFT_491938 [Linnemannia elongata]
MEYGSGSKRAITIFGIVLAAIALVFSLFRLWRACVVRYNRQQQRLRPIPPGRTLTVTGRPWKPEQPVISITAQRTVITIDEAPAPTFQPYQSHPPVPSTYPSPPPPMYPSMTQTQPLSHRMLTKAEDQR